MINFLKDIGIHNGKMLDKMFRATCVFTELIGKLNEHFRGNIILINYDEEQNGDEFIVIEMLFASDIEKIIAFLHETKFQFQKCFLYEIIAEKVIKISWKKETG